MSPSFQVFQKSGTQILLTTFSIVFGRVLFLSVSVTSERGGSLVSVCAQVHPPSSSGRVATVGTRSSASASRRSAATRPTRTPGDLGVARQKRHHENFSINFPTSSNTKYKSVTIHYLATKCSLVEISCFHKFRLYMRKLFSSPSFIM